MVAREAAPIKNTPRGDTRDEPNPMACATGCGGGTMLIKELAETLVRTLVDNPDQVVVSAIEGDQSSVIEFRIRSERVVPDRSATVPDRGGGDEVKDDSKNGGEPGDKPEDERLPPHPGKRMRTPADMLRLTSEVRSELIANRARKLWRDKGLLPELEAECWLQAEAELEQKV